MKNLAKLSSFRTDHDPDSSSVSYQSNQLLKWADLDINVMGAFNRPKQTQGEGNNLNQSESLKEEIDGLQPQLVPIDPYELVEDISTRLPSSLKFRQISSQFMLMADFNLLVKVLTYYLGSLPNVKNLELKFMTYGSKGVLRIDNFCDACQVERELPLISKMMKKFKGYALMGSRSLTMVFNVKDRFMLD
ncbi:hypothetical protein [Roseivirga sp.]|uniref:hypothetical protein n=1 Tax=Roseivirga sp. TaxID=1964215 RepID=UPI003B515E06